MQQTGLSTGENIARWLGWGVSTPIKYAEKGVVALLNLLLDILIWIIANPVYMTIKVVWQAVSFAVWVIWTGFSWTCVNVIWPAIVITWNAGGWVIYQVATKIWWVIRYIVWPISDPLLGLAGKLVAVPFAAMLVLPALAMSAVQTPHLGDRVVQREDNQEAGVVFIVVLFGEIAIIIFALIQIV